MFSFTTAWSNSISVYFNRPYNNNLNERDKFRIDSILTGVINDDSDTKYELNIEWIQYDGAMDVIRDEQPSFGIITTGMYSQIQYLTNNESGIKILGVVKKYGTTTYNYFILVKKNIELKPAEVKGKISMKKKTSLSGSLFPLAYLVDKHKFNKELISDDVIREEWGTIQRYHNKLSEIMADTAKHHVYFGEGLPHERSVFESNGWDVYPSLDDSIYNFPITRSVLFSNKLENTIVEKLHRFFLTPGSDRNFIVESFNIEGIAPIDNGLLNTVTNRYRSILYVSGFDELFEKIQNEKGLYILALILLLISHLLFRYHIAQQKDKLIWVILTITIKSSFFIVFVWFLPANAVYFIPAAVVVGATEKKLILKAFEKLKIGGVQIN